MTTTTVQPYVPPPDPAECERAYSELVDEETERRRALLDDQTAEQAKLVKATYAARLRTLDETDGALLWWAGDELAAGTMTASVVWEGAAVVLLRQDDLRAERVAELTRLQVAASDQLTDWFIDFAGPEGMVRFEGQARGCVCSRELAVVAAAQIDRVRAFLADEAASQSSLVRRLSTERHWSLENEARIHENRGSLGGSPAIEVSRRGARILSERSEALLQITNRESQRHRDFFFNFHSPEAQSLLEYACSLP